MRLPPAPAPLSSLAVGLLTLLPLAPAGAADPAPAGEWRHYGGDPGSSKYSALDQITRANVGKLQVAWRWKSPDNAVRARNPLRLADLIPFIHEPTPLCQGGVLYTSTSFGQVAALDPVTGQTKWVYDPGTWKGPRPTNLGWVHRGVAFWRDGAPGASGGARVIWGTGDAYLLAVDAKTGKPVEGFGDKGRVDLTKGLRREVNRRQYAVTSPPAVVGDVVVVGSSILDLPPGTSMPPGDVRGFDARTGKQLWTFQTVPQPGEFGHDTWGKGSWKSTGNTNAWAPFSVDVARGTVFVPVGTPTNDWYGGHRPGDNLFADSLVCLDAATGKRVWHQQLVHHGLWDYDTPAAPTLADVVVKGTKVPVVAQVTKQGFCFVFDRRTGKPIWPIEERPVPASKVPGEVTAKTQPFPTRPAPYERQGVTDDDLIDFTPELRREALAIARKYETGPLFTPPSLGGTINLPGWIGGSNWQGAALDPESGVLFVPSVTSPIVVQLAKTKPADRTDFDYARTLKAGVAGPRGLPLVKPPYGRLTSIDLNTGDHLWQVPLGVGPREHPALKDVKGLPDRLGWPRRGQILATKTLVFVGQEGKIAEVIDLLRDARLVEALNTRMTDDPKLCAFDKKTGAVVAEVRLPDNVTGAPMTYLAGGRQFIVFPVGGLLNADELVALALPE